VDETMKKWGMPMGPFELLDEIGLDIGAHVLKSLGSKLDPPLKPSPTVGRALERKWLGKKTGCGFYIHGRKKGAKIKPNEELISLLTAVPSRVEPSEADIVNRLVLPMVNEAARLLSEGVTDSAETVDLATVLGIGFAPFRGGLAKFADKLTVDELVTMMGDLARRHGLRFRPAPVLDWLAKEKKPFADAVQYKPAPAVPAPAAPAETAAAASRDLAESVVRSPHA
jgi:3-hydroxyacyl-CoA dehydrogenase/enoyl-CoA hydratase/3-hydroxybutyryl-CoA epimerase